MTHGEERGSVALELAVLASGLLALIALVIVGGRVANARSNVQEAARVAARAASLATTYEQATTDAQAAAEATITDGDLACSSLAVTLDGTFLQGELVEATVSCIVPTADLAEAGLPGTMQIEARYEEVIDTHRGIGP